VSLEEVETIGELLDEGILKPPRFLPLYLEKIRPPELPPSRISLPYLFALDLSQD
jgi:hypothetical protein